MLQNYSSKDGEPRSFELNSTSKGELKTDRYVNTSLSTFSYCDQYMMRHLIISFLPPEGTVYYLLRSCLSFIIGYLGFITGSLDFLAKFHIKRWAFNTSFFILCITIEDNITYQMTKNASRLIHIPRGYGPNTGYAVTVWAMLYLRLYLEEMIELMISHWLDQDRGRG